MPTEDAYPIGHLVRSTFGYAYALMLRQVSPKLAMFRTSDSILFPYLGLSVCQPTMNKIFYPLVKCRFTARDRQAQIGTDDQNCNTLQNVLTDIKVYNGIIYNDLNICLCPFDCTTVVGSGKVGL